MVIRYHEARTLAAIYGRTFDPAVNDKLLEYVRSLPLHVKDEIIDELLNIAWQAACEVRNKPKQ